MLDAKLLRENPEIVRNDLKKRNQPEKLKLVDDFLDFDKKLREKQKEADMLKHRRNILSKEISELKKKKKDFSDKLKEAEKIPEKIQKLDEEIIELKKRLEYILMRLPNILHESVPIGKDDSENMEIRKWGKIPKFDFPIKDHIDLGIELGGIDIERAAKISGSRFFFLKGQIAQLDMAIMKFAMDFITAKGFKLVIPPFAIKRRPYEGVTDLDAFEEMLYKIENEDLYLIATSEHPLIAQHMDETLNAKDLPLKYAGFSQCFRKEAGAHGKDTKGIFRVHQFNKVEQIIFCKPEDSWDFHETLIKNAEELYKLLELPYRIVNVCTGDIGTVAAKKYDLEVWMPIQKKYRENVSCSNVTDYQARRLNIKYREKEGQPPKGFVHTLNSTLIVDRAIVAILENFQQKDGSVLIPKVLRPYMNGVEKLTKS